MRRRSGAGRRRRTLPSRGAESRRGAARGAEAGGGAGQAAPSGGAVLGWPGPGGAGRTPSPSGGGGGERRRLRGHDGARDPRREPRARAWRGGDTAKPLPARWLSPRRPARPLKVAARTWRGAGSGDRRNPRNRAVLPPAARTGRTRRGPQSRTRRWPPPSSCCTRAMEARASQRGPRRSAPGGPRRRPAPRCPSCF